MICKMEAFAILGILNQLKETTGVNFKPYFSNYLKIL